MFIQMRQALDIPKSVDILEHIYTLDAAGQEQAHKKIQAIEREAMAQQVPQIGLVALMEALDRGGVRKGICTWNFEYVASLSC